MRKYSVPIMVVLLTFSSGLVAYRLFRPNGPQLSSNDPVAISLCELERHPDQYDGKLVQVKAVLYADVGGPYIYDWSCGSQNIYTYPLIDIRGFDGLTPELNEWSKNIGSFHAKGEGMESDVIVTGLFDKSYANPGDDAFSHHFRIIPRRVQQLSALHGRE
jgi:hypothetical protein